MHRDHNLCSKQPGIISIWSLISNPPSPGKSPFPGKHIFSDKGKGERGINLTDGDKSQRRSQVRQIKPMPINQVMQRLFTFAETTLKFSWQNNCSRKRNSHIWWLGPFIIKVSNLRAADLGSGDKPKILSFLWISTEIFCTLVEFHLFVPTKHRSHGDKILARVIHCIYCNNCSYTRHQSVYCLDFPVRIYCTEHQLLFIPTGDLFGTVFRVFNFYKFGS